MKTSLAVAVGTAFLLAAGAPLAQDAKAPASNPSTMAPQSGSPMGMGSRMAQMDEHTQMMKALHEKLASATTPEARQILMDKQRAEMQDCMAMMNDMKKGDGKMGAMGGGMMEQKGAPPDANAQMQMMQKRMGMMEMMMQTMMDQHEMMAGAKSSVATPKM
ncbi:MAG: hypothetical protein ABI645_15965 [Pseudomonadota bacterium]